MTHVRFRQCPVNPACGSIEGWNEFLVHIFEAHTEGGPEESRWALVERLLKRKED